MNINYEVNRLINFAVQNNLIDELDAVYASNLLLEVLNLDEFEEVEVDEKLQTATPILENMLDYAVEKGMIEDTTTERDLFDTKIMNALMPRPSEVIKTFNEKYKNNKEEATDYYYKMSIASNYIRKDRTDKNIVWKTPTEYGDLEITVNLSKPEKDPKEIAKAKLMKAATYPKCLLCVENVGYQGRLNHPARQNHRVIPLELQNKQWYMQYSPYVYYNEHCIVFSGKHEPMKLTKDSLTRLVEFIDKFPHYFIGSNADLPIVGGSILTHDHYQGGRHKFPMEMAAIEKTYTNHKFEDVEIGTVKWPMTVVRLSSNNKDRVINAAMEIYNSWKGYSDEENDILAYSGDVPHNTVTPIARRNGDAYEMDIVLRNNRTTEEYPDGIFHPHEELHHIKKENIGLIEVMGLAVLPGRLQNELELIADLLCDNTKYNKEEALNNPALDKHVPWIEELIEQNRNVSLEEARRIVKESVGQIFSRVLEDAGVFKRTEKGQRGLEKFITESIY